MVNGQLAHVDDEETYRKKLRIMARTINCLKEFDLMMEKYENILKRCGNKQERMAIKSLCLAELNELFNGSTSVGYGGNLTMGGKVIVSQELKKDDGDGK